MKTAEYFDIVIVGAGVTGALVADRLSREKGLRVLILEAGSSILAATGTSSATIDPGRLAAVGRWASADKKSLTTPYRDAQSERHAPFPDRSSDYVNAGPDPFKSTYVRRTGGTTWHWLGHTPRMLPADFRMRSQYGVGVDWPITYDDIEAQYCKAERELGVAGDHDIWNGVGGAYRSAEFPMPMIWPSYSDRQFQARVAGLEIGGRPLVVRPIPQARNSEPYQDRPACAGNSTCIPICPIGAKYDATVHLRRAMYSEFAKSEVEIIDRAVVRRLVIEAGRVVRLEYTRWGGPAKQEATATALHSVIAGTYVVAAHAVESARLLLNSGLPDPSGTLGANLMDHPTGQVIGLAPEPWYPFRGPPVTSGLDEWRDGPERAERAAWKASLGNDGFGRRTTPEQFVESLMASHGFGASLRERIEREGTRMFRVSFAVEQLPDPANRIVAATNVDALGVPEVRLAYRIGEYTWRAYANARTTITRALERAGVTGIRFDKPGDFGGSGHIMGTCRMGATSREGVVDADGRTFTCPNLFVVGSATFPTVGTANPTLTAAALALRTAECIARQR